MWWSLNKPEARQERCVTILKTAARETNTNLSNQQYANYHEIRSHVRRFIIRIYGRRAIFNSLIFCWMNDINQTI